MLFLLVKYDLETDTWCTLYEKIALNCWIPDKTKKYSNYDGKERIIKYR